MKWPASSWARLRVAELVLDGWLLDSGSGLGLGSRDLRFRHWLRFGTLEDLGGRVRADDGHESLLIGAGGHDHGNTLVRRRRLQVALAFGFDGQRAAAYWQGLLRNDDECAIIVGDGLADLLAIEFHDDFRSRLGGACDHGLARLFNADRVEGRNFRLLDGLFGRSGCLFRLGCGRLLLGLSRLGGLLDSRS